MHLSRQWHYSCIDLGQKSTEEPSMPVLLKDLLFGVVIVCLMMVFTTLVQAAAVVPTEIQMPGTQPQVMAASATWHTITTAVYPQLQR
jgi:hypothetical protein